MHELGLLLAEARTEEIERKVRRHVERPAVLHGLERRRFWRRVR
jgi:hypothetical protein